MMETLERIIAFHVKVTQKQLYGLINTHIGDARATDMSKDNTINLDKLGTRNKK